MDGFYNAIIAGLCTLTDTHRTLAIAAALIIMLANAVAAALAIAADVFTFDIASDMLVYCIFCITVSPELQQDDRRPFSVSLLGFLRTGVSR